MLVTIVPSLQKLAIVKIAVCVYTNPEVREFENNSMGHFGFYATHERNWVSFIRERVSQCELREDFQKKVITYMKPLSLELSSWHRCLRDMFVFLAEDISPVWSSSGAIDQLRTAKKLVHCQDLPFLERFSLACLFWMSDDILKIWEKASSQEKEKAIRNVIRNEFSIFMNEADRKLRSEFLKKWITWIKKGAVDHEQYYFYGFALFSMPYIPMQSHLLTKSSPQLVLESLGIRLRSNGRLNNLEYICLVNLDVKYQNELYKTKPYGLLRAFLHWPLQSHFLEMADRLWSYLTEDDFDQLLCSILEKLRQGWEDANYGDLLKRFFFRSPKEFRILDKKSAFFRSHAPVLFDYFDLRQCER
ncbi:uncharacterized protein TNCT_676861 [Trichonephila clavata]|uniref:Uncharacterized protein n=1 Tax=Trichonephila clavata TaxID=2740835 RepID=A0A8X6F5N1_TRICU|nr:uncharacterized protein TNCT_676861 [Trichonephila clavata]